MSGIVLGVGSPWSQGRSLCLEYLSSLSKHLLFFPFMLAQTPLSNSSQAYYQSYPVLLSLTLPSSSLIYSVM